MPARARVHGHWDESPPEASEHRASDWLVRKDRLRRADQKTNVQEEQVDRERAENGHGRPQDETDSELTDDDVLLSFRDDQLVGITVLNASTRLPALSAK
jgi:hypothetical protein